MTNLATTSFPPPLFALNSTQLDFEKARDLVAKAPPIQVKTKSFFCKRKVPRVLLFDETDSTNLICQKLIDFTPLSEQKKLSNLCVVSKKQTAGRGRLGRTFFSPLGGVYFSFIWRGFSKKPGRVTALAAVALLCAAKKVFEVDCAIKWVNDLILNGKKVAGILCQGFAKEKEKPTFTVIGIGVNLVLGEGVPKEIAQTATSLLNREPTEKERELFIKELATQLYTILSSPISQRKASKEYKKHSILTGQKVLVKSVAASFPPFFATVLGVTRNFLLKVRTDDGKKLTLSSAEVTLHKEEG